MLARAFYSASKSDFRLVHYSVQGDDLHVGGGGRCQGVVAGDGRARGARGARAESGDGAARDVSVAAGYIPMSVGAAQEVIFVKVRTRRS